MVLKKREGEQYRKAKENYPDYAFYVHGDYSTEWIKCIEAKPGASRYLVVTPLLPNATQEVKPAFLLLGDKNNP